MVAKIVGQFVGEVDFVSVQSYQRNTEQDGQLFDFLILRHFLGLLAPPWTDPGLELRAPVIVMIID